MLRNQFSFPRAAFVSRHELSKDGNHESRGPFAISRRGGSGRWRMIIRTAIAGRGGATDIELLRFRPQPSPTRSASVSERRCSPRRPRVATAMIPLAKTAMLATMMSPCGRPKTATRQQQEPKHQGEYGNQTKLRIAEIAATGRTRRRRHPGR
jgi:hypothetical protein